MRFAPQEEQNRKTMRYQPGRPRILSPAERRPRIFSCELSWRGRVHRSGVTPQMVAESALGVVESAANCLTPPALRSARRLYSPSGFAGDAACSESQRCSDAGDLQRITAQQICQRRLHRTVLSFFTLWVGAGVTLRITSPWRAYECAASVHPDVSSALGGTGGSRHEPFGYHLPRGVYRTAPHFCIWLPPS